MDVVFTSTIMLSDNGQTWCVHLCDTQTRKTHVCDTLEAYEACLEKLAAPYGGRVDHVAWSCDAKVPPFMLDEVRFAMAAFQEKYHHQLDT